MMEVYTAILNQPPPLFAETEKCFYVPTFVFPVCCSSTGEGQAFPFLLHVFTHDVNFLVFEFGAKGISGRIVVIIVIPLPRAIGAQ